MILNENSNGRETKMKANQKLFTQLLITNCCINKKNYYSAGSNVKHFSHGYIRVSY